MPAGATNPSTPDPHGSAVEVLAVNRVSADVRSTEIETLLRHAEEALATIDTADVNLPPGAHPLELQDFAAAAPHGELDVVAPHLAGEVELVVELGRVRLRVEDVLKLRKGSVAPLDPLVGAPVDVYAESRLVARGDVLVLDGRFCVRVTETFLSPND